MGWWAAPDNDELLVGDDVLDSVRRFLKDFSESYAEDLKRKPTLAELEYVMNLGFQSNVDDEILSGFDELEVKQVSIKTAKRPKRGNPKPGDIFAFKINDGRFCFGRIVSKLSFGTVVEIFDYFSNSAIFDYSKIDKWLFPPITISAHELLRDKSSGDWRLIGETKEFSPDQRMKNVWFVYGESPNDLMAVNAFNEKKSMTFAESEKCTYLSMRGDYDVKKMIDDHLASKK